MMTSTRTRERERLEQKQRESRKRALRRDRQINIGHTVKILRGQHKKSENNQTTNQ